MKSLSKVTLLATMIAVSVGSLSAKAAMSDFKTDDERSAYALGVSFAENMEAFYAEQEKLGFKLEKDQLIAGVQDGIAQKSKLNKEEVTQVLTNLEKQLQEKMAAQAEQDAKAQKEQGDKYRDEFAKESGVVKTESGLLYKIEQPGAGDEVKPTDVVEVNYRGTLIDGTEFDSSYKRNQTVKFPLNGVIAGWTEGIQQIKKGGKITLVIPPELAYGTQAVGNIPANSTLIFDVELVDVNPKAEDAKAE